MKYISRINRYCGVRKGTVLTKQIMLGVIGWKYIGKSFMPFDLEIPKKERFSCYVARNENNERVFIGKTMQEAEVFCLNKYKKFYDEHPEERDWLPNPYNRKKVVSKVVIVTGE